MCETRIYRIWAGILTRCTNPRAASYEDYGGRGIYVCPRWQKFENFLFDMGDPGLTATIERVNNDGPYEPENCRWASKADQNNNKRTNRLITHGGETMSAAQWANKLGIPRTTIIRRLNSGKPPKLVLSKESLPHAILGKPPPIAAIRRALTHCKAGHEFTAENTYLKPNGGRGCNHCRRAKSKAWNNAHRKPNAKRRKVHL